MACGKKLDSKVDMKVFGRGRCPGVDIYKLKKKKSYYLPKEMPKDDENGTSFDSVKKSGRLILLETGFIIIANQQEKRLIRKAFTFDLAEIAPNIKFCQIF